MSLPLSSIDHVREQAEAILERYGARDVLPEAALVLAWQLLFERLQRGDDEGIDKLVTSVQRLCASTNQRRAMLLKESQAGTQDESPTEGLTPELLRQIEAELG
ncbi:MAG: hypothetical protein E1N59_2282 [Puniceicoccaceae bacterium 5H]|nr:MAG: hypothetical protein E1N59_2282 [Puniceicoccaceae bacterium 5H]